MIAKEKPILSSRSARRAFFKKRAERRDPGARPNHDHRAVSVRGQFETVGRLHEDFDGTVCATIGEVTRARELCEKLLSYASPLQLYAEEIDPRSGRHLGNFPQAFSHLALINAVMHVIHAESGATHQFKGVAPSPEP